MTSGRASWSRNSGVFQGEGKGEKAGIHGSPTAATRTTATSALSVSAGQTVTADRQIGLSGGTGNVTGPHLHFEIRTTPDSGSDVDPVAYLRSKGLAVG